MPVIRSEKFGYQLHPIDLATNKVLALAGRDEPRDLVDTLYLHRNVLELGPLVWAAVGKDPGFSPLTLLELLRRRGKIRPEGLARLHLSSPMDVRQVKEDWMAALQSAEAFVATLRTHPASRKARGGCREWPGRLRAPLREEALSDYGVRGSRRSANSQAARMESGSAIPLPAISKAVP
jgi:hypothetical protein